VILRTTKNKVTKETTVAAPLSVLPSGLADYPHRLAVLAGLQGFRAELHACCTHRADALVDLADALLSTQGPVASLPQLSLEPAHRRGWGSLYAALARGRIQAERLRDLLARHPVVGGQPIYAVDVTTWPRCDAECSPERGLYYHPSRHSAGQPIVADQRLAWERPRPPGRLSPYRVRRGFPRLLSALGSPAAAPKPSGRSPGRPKGSCRGPATRHPAVKKPAKKPGASHPRRRRPPDRPSSASPPRRPRSTASPARPTA
jgi:hypothetical protein